MSDLKPCPFCGSLDVDTQHYDEVSNVCCDSCHAGYWTSDGEDAESIWNNRASPWRSLKDEPPEPPTEDTEHSIIVRANHRVLAVDRYRLLVPYRDRDNGNQWRWFESHMDDVLEDVVAWGYTDWMEVPR